MRAKVWNRCTETHDRYELGRIDCKRGEAEDVELSVVRSEYTALRAWRMSTND